MKNQALCARKNAGWARARGTSIRHAKAIATIVLPALYIFKAPGLIWFPKYTGEECGEQTNAQIDRQSIIFQRPEAAYGILQFIMRHTYVLIAILGVCFVSGRTSTKQQPKPKAPAPAASPAQPQPPSDEELMAKTAQATIDWDNSTTKGAKVDVLLIKKDQAQWQTGNAVSDEGERRSKKQTLYADGMAHHLPAAGNDDGWPGHCSRRHRGVPSEFRPEAALSA